MFERSVMKNAIMQRDILRDALFLAFLGIFFWQMYESVRSLQAKEKGLHVR